MPRREVMSKGEKSGESQGGQGEGAKVGKVWEPREGKGECQKVGPKGKMLKGSQGGPGGVLF